MFDNPVIPYEMDYDMVQALNVFWILHADHEQNCSTAAVRVVGSGQVNVYAAISAGISALWGPLHGGANQAVISMLEQIHNEGLTIDRAIERAKDKDDPFRLMGFGHRVYKTYDPRAKIMKKCATLSSRGAAPRAKTAVTPFWTLPWPWRMPPFQIPISRTRTSTPMWISIQDSS